MFHHLNYFSQNYPKFPLQIVIIPSTVMDIIAQKIDSDALDISICTNRWCPMLCVILQAAILKRHLTFECSRRGVSVDSGKTWIIHGRRLHIALSTWPLVRLGNTDHTQKQVSSPQLLLMLWIFHSAEVFQLISDMIWRHILYVIVHVQLCNKSPAQRVDCWTNPPSTVSKVWQFKVCASYLILRVDFGGSKTFSRWTYICLAYNVSF